MFWKNKKFSGFTRTPNLALLQCFLKVFIHSGDIKKKTPLNQTSIATKKTMPKLVCGFTLVELLVVLSIISFLASIILASMQSARDKAVGAKITEDLRQVKIAAELYYGDKQNYNFSFLDNIDRDILVDNKQPVTRSFDFNLIEKADAQTPAPPACVLFNSIAGNLYAGRYLSNIPIHPRQDYSKNICYKAAKTSDGTIFTAYAETPTTFYVGGSPTYKRVGFVVGDTSVPNLNRIREATNYEYLRNVGSTTLDITNVFEIVDEVIGITKGSAGNSGTSSGSSLGGDSGGGLLTSSCSLGEVLSNGVCVSSCPPGQTAVLGVCSLCPYGQYYNSSIGSCVVGMNNGCGYATYLANGVCMLTGDGCGFDEMGPCVIFPQPIYSCPTGKTFQINGQENTANGTCI